MPAPRTRKKSQRIVKIKLELFDQAFHSCLNFFRTGPFSECAMHFLVPFTNFIIIPLKETTVFLRIWPILAPKIPSSRILVAPRCGEWS
ncbi:hypothetical protein LXL04_029838 [Taraxacum kok-saghyz]